MVSCTSKPAVEWSPPTINSVSGALEDASCLLERLHALLSSNIDDMQDMIVHAATANTDLQRSAYSVWMIFCLSAEKLQEIEKIIAATVEVTVAQPVSPVARHTQLRRSQDWRVAADVLNAANASTDTSDEAITKAGNAYMIMRETRVASFADFREKFDIMAAADGALDAADVRELMLDLDVLGARARRAVAA